MSKFMSIKALKGYEGEQGKKKISFSKNKDKAVH